MTTDPVDKRKLVSLGLLEIWKYNVELQMLLIPNVIVGVSNVKSYLLA